MNPSTVLTPRAAPTPAQRSKPLLLRPAAKLLLFVLCLLPLAWLVYGAFTDGLGANPAEYLIRSTGDWTLRFICIVLAVDRKSVV